MTLNMNVNIKRGSFLGVSISTLRDPRTWLVLLAITEKNIFRYMMLVLNRITGIDGIGDLVLHLAYILLIGLCIVKGSRFRATDFLIMLSVVLAILLTWVIYPANIETYMFGEGQFWPTVFPLFRYFIVGLFLIPNEETITLMGKVSCLAILVESLFVYFILRDSDLQKNDDMSRAYFILLNVLLVINYAFDKRTLAGVVFSIIGFLFLVSMGTRGPVIIALSFSALKIILSSVNKGHVYFAIGAILLLIWFVNSNYWTEFLFMIQNILDSLGLSTRVIEIAMQGETLSYYSERDEIAQLVLSKIKERPLTGWGVYGEWQFVGWSAHNMYLEILDHYGIIIGGVVILWILFLNIKAYASTNVASVRSLVVLFACFSLIRGIFGGGFLTFPTFLTIGFFLQVCRRTNFKYLTVS